MSPLYPDLSGAYGVARRDFAPGFYYMSEVLSGSDATVVMAAGEAQAVPFTVDVAASFNQVSLEVTAAAGSSNVVCYLYSNGVGRPGALYANLGTLDTHTGTGIITAVVALTLPPAKYWIGGVAQGGNPTVRARGTQQAYMPQSTGGNVNAASFAVTGVTGALPDPFGTPTAFQISVPKVMLRCV